MISSVDPLYESIILLAVLIAFLVIACRREAWADSTVDPVHYGSDDRE